MKRLAGWIGLGCALAVVLAGCTGSHTGDAGGTTVAGSEERTQPTFAATTIAAATTAPSGAEDAPALLGGGDDGELTRTDPVALGRLIVFTANLTVEVDDVVAAGERAQSVVAGLGGFLFGQETQIGERSRSVLTIKVLPENFSAALQRLADLGTLTEQTVFADDVTDRVVDLRSQITTAAASVERLRGFLADAESLEDLAAFEAELLRRETDLEVLRGRLRTLEDSVALATIVVVLTEPTPPTPEPAIEVLQTGYVGHDGGESCPGTGELTIDEGQPMTLCFAATNVGDTALVDVEVRDNGLDAQPDDLIVVEGDLEEPVLPGESLILAFETSAEVRTFPRLAVTANPVDADGRPIRRGVEANVEQVSLDVVEDDSLPGFTDAMGEAWQALQRILGVVVVVSGALVPFLWVPLVALAIVWWRRRNEEGSVEEVDALAAATDE